VLSPAQQGVRTGRDAAVRRVPVTVGRVVALMAAGLLPLSSVGVAAAEADWQTHYEKSGYAATPSYADTLTDRKLVNSLSGAPARGESSPPTPR
jgi:hypothetical protein